jgi:hypothetical protein
VTVLELYQAAGESLSPGEVWQYRWEMTLTVRSATQITVRRIVVDSPDRLAELVLHTSYDPRIVSYRYHRYLELDMSRAPTACATCAEPYTGAAPTRQSCSCGGHEIYACSVCGTDQVYPRVENSCC